MPDDADNAIGDHRDDNAQAPLRVLILRPEHQALALTAGCREAGFDPVLLPSLSIEALPQTQEAPRTGVVIFTSANAVRHGAALRRFPWPGVRVHAIGPATDKALHEAGQETVAAPRPPYNSEALLEALLNTHAASLQDGVTIITGQNSRACLADRLREAKVEVQVIATYRRVCPDVSTEEVIRRLSPLPDVVCVPSNEALRNLSSLLSRPVAAVYALPLVVNNQRALEHARHLGFTGPGLVSAAAGDAAQLTTLCAWRARESLAEHSTTKTTTLS